VWLTAAASRRAVVARSFCTFSSNHHQRRRRRRRRLVFFYSTTACVWGEGGAGTWQSRDVRTRQITSTSQDEWTACLHRYFRSYFTVCPHALARTLLLVNQYGGRRPARRCFRRPSAVTFVYCMLCVDPLIGGELRDSGDSLSRGKCYRRHSYRKYLHWRMTTDNNITTL